MRFTIHKENLSGSKSGLLQAALETLLPKVESSTIS